MAHKQYLNMSNSEFLRLEDWNPYGYATTVDSTISTHPYSVIKIAHLMTLVSP